MSLLSRVAERIYWSARYLERAETTSRLARVYGNLLLDLPRQAGLKWDALIQITGGAEIYRELHPSPGLDTAERFFVADKSNPSSVRSSLLHARESIRTTRDIVPSEAWRSVNELCMYVGEELDAVTSHRRRYGIHTRVVEGCREPIPCAIRRRFAPIPEDLAEALSTGRRRLEGRVGVLERLSPVPG